MNMISTGAFLDGMDASNKQNTLVSKLVAAWEKKNAKIARAGGVSLMALSLAACGSDDDDAATPAATPDTTPVADVTPVAPVVVAPVVVNGKMEVGVDTLKGNGGNDTFSGTAGNTNPTLTAGDTVDGGDGDDLILMVSTGAADVNIAGIGLTSVETVRVADSTTGGNTTVNLAGQSGITTLESFGSAQTGLINFSNVNAIADLNLSNTSGGGTTTVTYTATATAGDNTQNIHLSTAAQTGDVTVAGVETFAITADAPSSMALAAAAATSVTANSGAHTLSLDLDAAVNTSLITVDASKSTGAQTITIDANLAGDGMTVTGGTGNDIIDSSAGVLGATDTIDGGDGTDTLRVQATADTLSATIAVNLATITNVERLELEADNDAGAGTAADFTIDMDFMDGVTSVILDSNDTETASIFNLDDLSAVQAGAITVQGTAEGAAGDANGSTINLDLKDGTGTADSATITASNKIGNTITVGDDNGNIEAVTINLTGAADVTLAIATTDFAGTAANPGSMTVTGGGDGNTMTITGGASNIVADTVNLTGVKSDTTMTMGTVNATVTGGTGDDDVTFGDTLTSADSFDGGDGNDRLILDPATSIFTAPTISNVEELEIGATATTSFVLTGAAIPEIILQAQAGVTLVATITNMAGITNITADSGAANTLDDFNGITLTGTGYAGLADAVTIDVTSDTDQSTFGILTLTGMEDVTVNITGSDADLDTTFTNIEGTSINNVVVTSTGYGAVSDTQDIVLATVGSGAAGTNGMESFTAAGANTGVTGTFDSMNVGSTVTGSAFNDTFVLTGSLGSVTASGGAGTDTLTAAAAGSTLNGDAGTDTLNGAAGVDNINGGAGVDTITGNAGNDIITSGTGADTIVRNGDGATDDSDTITDFTAGAGGDIIDFTTNNATNGATGKSGLAQATTGTIAVGTGLVVHTGNNLASVDEAGVEDLFDATTSNYRLQAASDEIYFLAGDGTNAYLFFLDCAAGNTEFTAADDVGVLVATFTGITDTTTITAANFADFV